MTVTFRFFLLLFILPSSFIAFADKPLNAGQTELICKTSHKH